MPQRNVATNFTFEQQRLEINQLAQDFWTQKGTVDTAASTYLKHDGTNNFTGGTLAVPAAFTINSNSGAGTVTIAGNLQVDGTTTTVNTATMDVVDKNITIAKGSANDAAADGAGITIDSGTDITWNFVDANDAWVSSIGVEATTFLKGPYGQFTGSGTPSAGQGLELNAPDANTGQIISYDRGNSAYKDLRIKGTGIDFYAGSTNAIVGGFHNTGLIMQSGKGITCPGDLDVDGTSTFGANGTITAGANFSLNGNALTVTGSQTVVAEFKKAGSPTIQCTDTTNSTDLQLRANADGGLVRTATNKPLVFGTNQAERLRITSEGYLKLAGTISGSNNKLGRFLMPSHDSGEEDVMYMQFQQEDTYNQLEFGGGSSSYNAATQILFRTAAVDTVTGVERLRIASDGTISKYHNATDISAAFGGGGQVNGVTALPSMVGTPFVVAKDTGSGRSATFAGVVQTGSIISTQLTATQGATTEFIQATSTNNGTRAVGSFAGKDSSGNAVTLKMGGYGDTQRGEIFTHSNHALGFATNNAATQMVLDTGGRLIIGNTSDLAPDGFGSKIQVNSANHEGSIQIGRHTANSNGPILIFNKTRSGTAVPGNAALSRDDMLGGVRFFGSDGTDYNCNAGGIQAYMDGDVSNNNFPGRLEFLTTTSGSPQGSVKMTISENGAIVTPLGSPLSYHATNATYEIYNDDHEIAISDSTSGWHVMKQWTATKSGQFFIKFQGKIDSGPYYWAGDVYNLTQGKRINQSGNAPNSEALNGLKAFRFADLLDTNDTSAGNAVHEFRRHKLKCGNNSGSYVGEVKPGDIIQLRMASAGNNGALVTGSGQNLRCQNFRIYSDTPGRETGGKEFNPNNAAFHAIMGGGATAFNQGDDLTWDSTSFNRGYVTDSNNATVEYGFDVANNCFRVPHTGIYHFYVNFFINAASNCRISIEVDGSTYTSGYIWGCNVDEGQATANQGGSQSLYLGKGSVVKLNVQSGAIGNTYGGHTSWGGFLVG